MIKKLLYCATFLFLCNAGHAQIKSDSAAIKSGITFSINFESGSLDSVSCKEMMMILPQMQAGTERLTFDIFSRYDPLNPADPKLPPSARWYHFLMDGVKDKEVILNIHNSDARRPFYSYDGKNYVRFSDEECAVKNTIRKKYEQSRVYIAYFVPYTESYLNSRIEEWKKNDCVEITSIGKSEHGRNMPLLIVTNHNIGNDTKKIVYIHGRIHTSETPGSWHLDKMIDILAGDSQYAKELRDHIVFYILPFANPDGVQEGMSRSNAKGINLEVNWDSPDTLTSQEVKNIRAFLGKLTSTGKPVDIMLNMHSQSANFVTYWVHKAESTSERYYKNLMLFSNLTINENPHFYKNDLSFSNVAPRYIEGWFWDKFGEKTVAICFETPYTYYNNNRNGEWATIENLQSMAIHNVYAIGDYLGIQTSERIIVPEPKKGKKFKRENDLNHIYFGDSYLLANKAGASVKYKLKSLSQGKYGVYKWNTGENLTASNKGENEWIKIGTHIQNNNGKFVYIYQGNGPGDKADNLLLIKEE